VSLDWSSPLRPNLTTISDYAAEIYVRDTKCKSMLLLTRFKDKISAIVDIFRYDYNYHSWGQKKIEVPFVWLTTSAIFLFAFALFAPADLDYGRVSPGQTSFFATINNASALGKGFPSGDINLVRSNGGVVTPQSRTPIGVHFYASNLGMGATVHRRRIGRPRGDPNFSCHH